MFYHILSILSIYLNISQADSADSDFSNFSSFSSNLRDSTRQILEGCSEVIYQNNCLISTIPEAITQVMHECLPSEELGKTMWNDFLIFAKTENSQAIETAFELFDVFFSVFFQNNELMLIISKSMCDIGKNNTEDLPKDYYDRMILAVNNLTSAEHYILAEDLIVCLDFIVYSSKKTEFYNQTEIKEHNYWYKSAYVNLNNTNSLTMQIDSTIFINNESDDSKYLATVFLSSYSKNQIYDVMIIDLDTGGLKTIPVKVIIKNDFASDYIICKKYINDDWQSSLCSIKNISNEQVYITSESPGIFSIFENCSTTFIPEAITIGLISLALIIIPIFISLDRCKQNKQVSAYSASYKPNQINSDTRETYSTETNGQLSPKVAFTVFFIRSHLFLALKEQNHLKRLKILLIYINSIIIQLGFALLLFRNHRHNYYNSMIIAIITASVAGIITFIACFLRVENLIFQKLIFSADAIIGIVFAINIFIRDAGCIYKYWFSAFFGSIFIDLIVIQTCLIFIRRLFSNAFVKKDTVSQS
ncbi:hypothetical protein SteCoe_94 [Stentor coeruleus]|uniref:Uncharacterized protein n=1 Tax=Stentor coeruleus TaxID=5963 RepID=A0A1R2D531_9CILI|nr:hypothetical protein SteCoe_94 [Stentor coeruleus]